MIIYVVRIVTRYIYNKLRGFLNVLHCCIRFWICRVNTHTDKILLHDRYTVLSELGRYINLVYSGPNRNEFSSTGQEFSSTNDRVCGELYTAGYPRGDP